MEPKVREIIFTGRPYYTLFCTVKFFGITVISLQYAFKQNTHPPIPGSYLGTLHWELAPLAGFRHKKLNGISFTRKHYMRFNKCMFHVYVRLNDFHFRDKDVYTGAQRGNTFPQTSSIGVSL